jgi:hypothetical protein
MRSTPSVNSSNGSTLKRTTRDGLRSPTTWSAALTDGLVFDAVRIRSIEIGEAVRAIDPAVLDEIARISGVPGSRVPAGWR